MGVSNIPLAAIVFAVGAGFHAAMAIAATRRWHRAANAMVGVAYATSSAAMFIAQ